MGGYSLICNWGGVGVLEDEWCGNMKEWLKGKEDIEWVWCSLELENYDCWRGDSDLGEEMECEINDM